MRAARSGYMVWTIALLAGCQGAGYDRIPATAVNNPDPLLGNRIPKTDLPAAPPAESAAAPARSDAPLTPTSQSRDDHRIGPLTFRPTAAVRPAAQPSDGFSPGPATLAVGAREPKQESPTDQQVRPVSATAPASDPEVVKGYRKRLLDHQAVTTKTRLLENGSWQAIVYFELPNNPGSLQRLEALGVTEADALLAILEDLEKKKK